MVLRQILRDEFLEDLGVVRRLLGKVGKKFADTKRSETRVLREDEVGLIVKRCLHAARADIQDHRSFGNELGEIRLALLNGEVMEIAFLGVI